MKAKLLSKSLLFLAMFALVGCGRPQNPTSEPSEPTGSETTETPSESETPTATDMTVSGVIAWDGDSNSPTFDGQLVRLVDVVVNAKYSDTRLCVQKVEGETLKAIEIVTAEATTFDAKDIVTVTGTVSSEDGRPQIVDATIEWGTGGEAACKASGPINYYQELTRAQWDYNISRSWSGVYLEITWQVATVPTIVPGQETVFYVAYPGENLDVTDEENYSYIDVIIPALTEAQAEVVGEWAETLEVGCGVFLFAQAYFRNYVSLILPYTSFRFNGTNEVVELTNVFATFEELELAQTVLDLDMPSFASEFVFSWTYSVYENYEIEETGEQAPLLLVTANVKTADVENALADIIDYDPVTQYAGLKYEAEGWYLVYAGAVDEEGTIGYAFANGTLVETEEDGETVYDLVDSTAQILVYPGLSTVNFEISPLTTDIVGKEEGGDTEASKAEQLMQLICDTIFGDATAYDDVSAMVGMEAYATGVVMPASQFSFATNDEAGHLACIEFIVEYLSGFGLTESQAPAYEDGYAEGVYTTSLVPSALVVISAYWSAEDGAIVCQIIVASTGEAEATGAEQIMQTICNLLFEDATAYEDISAILGMEAYGTGVLMPTTQFPFATNDEAGLLACIEFIAEYISGLGLVENGAPTYDATENAAWATYFTSDYSAMIQISAYWSAEDGAIVVEIIVAAL